ncbi:MAG: DUF3445 domain-containing protein [Rhodobacteraceae bacterium]|nr:MAG: DUF3445 domain-containing protein [Paracoccaceae bacterium]
MAILHTHLPYAPWTRAHAQRLPGTMALPRAEWLLVDAAYAGQMRERARLLAERPAEVLAIRPDAQDAAYELLEEVVDDLPRLGFECDGDQVHCPDRRRVTLDRARPLWTLGHLLQADFCLLQKPPGAAEHVLTGAVLCFPSSWTLAEKLGHPLMRIHQPVDSYDTAMGARVQRMFDLIRPEQPMWRVNLLEYADPTLFQPRREADPKDRDGAGQYLRSERQCLLKLRHSGAVVFSIHTAMIHRDSLTPEQAAALPAHLRSAQAPL